MAELSTIEMSGDKIPILCTLSVLEEIQDEFGTVQEFSDKLAPFLKEKGNEKKDQKLKMPDIHAIVYALPRFVNEGIEVYNENHKIKLEKMSNQQIFRRCDQSLLDISMALYKELWRSINAPKQLPPGETSRS